MISNGDLIQVPGQPEIYLVQNGQRCHIPNMETFWAREFALSQIKLITAQAMLAVPLGPVLDSAVRYEFSPKDFLGAGHYMTTTGAFSTATGLVRATTVTETITWFGGFHGAVSLAGFDQSSQGVILFATDPRSFGVDGRLIGRSKREDFWSENIDLAVARQVGEVRIVHGWNPQDLKTALRRAVDTVLPLADLLPIIQGIAKIANPGTPKT
jgi:hypothetical protein